MAPKPDGPPTLQEVGDASGSDGHLGHQAPAVCLFFIDSQPTDLNVFPYFQHRGCRRKAGDTTSPMRTIVFSIG